MLLLLINQKSSTFQLLSRDITVSALLFLILRLTRLGGKKKPLDLCNRTPFDLLFMIAGVTNMVFSGRLVAQSPPDGNEMEEAV